MPAYSISSVLTKIMDNEIKFVDLRFTDLQGQQHHFTIPAQQVDQDFFEQGRMFDGSSFAGWKHTENSDMILMPDPRSAIIDPFLEHKTLILTCNVIEPDTLKSYQRDPRSVALRAEEYLKSTSIADIANLGPENEFFVFDAIEFSNKPNNLSVRLHSSESMWETGLENGGLGHRSAWQKGYSPLPPRDKLHDLRSEMCEMIEAMGIKVEIHHREVASAGQCEIGVAFNSLLQKADEVQTFKYAVKNTALQFGKTATFMPKPYHGESGSGMHIHVSLVKDGVNLFTGDQYGGLSQTALYFIGGIIEHARSLNAFTNASTNSYKRLVPHYEAPVMLAYSCKNRTASIRIPHIPNPKARRIEVRFPDSTANPYLAFSAVLMAGLDGIENKIEPGPALDKNLYDLSAAEFLAMPKVCANLDEALKALETDHHYLLKGNVFDEDMIHAYIALKRDEVRRVNETPHPVEYELYYSL